MTEAELEARRAEAARNRARMPETAAIVDEFRRVFGAKTRLRWAREGGIEVGVIPEECRDQQQR